MGEPVGERVVTAKPCTICGIDCAGRPRVKDAQGRYFCDHCFELTKQTQQVQKAPPKPPQTSAFSNALPEDNSFLLDLPAAAVTAPEVHRCPECARPMSTTAKLCVACGYDTTSGKRVNVKVEKTLKAPEAPGEVSVSTFLGSIPLAVLGSAIGAAVGAVVWTLVVTLSGYELSILAWAVGGITGLGAVIGARRAAGNTSGVIAAAFALAAVAAGKYFSVTMLLASKHLNVPMEQWLPKVLSPFDVLWVFLALATAWRVGSARRE